MTTQATRPSSSKPYNCPVLSSEALDRLTVLLGRIYRDPRHPALDARHRKHGSASAVLLAAERAVATHHAQRRQPIIQAFAAEKQERDERHERWRLAGYVPSERARPGFSRTGKRLGRPPKKSEPAA